MELLSNIFYQMIKFSDGSYLFNIRVEHVAIQYEATFLIFKWLPLGIDNVRSFGFQE